MTDYNIAEGKIAQLKINGLTKCYRAQKYAPGLNEKTINPPNAWQHYNFSRNIKNNRFIPLSTNVYVTYFGFDPLAVFVETDASFRNSSLKLKRPLLFSQEELRKKEIITFEFQDELKLFDLCEQFALVRHNLKPNSDVLISTDYSASHIFAEQVYQAGFEGILYPTRQGIKNAVVLFDSARHKMENTAVISRKSVLTTLQETPKAESDLGIKICKFT